MAILANKNTKILIQGITGTQASFHVRRSIGYGTNVVAGVTPGKGGITHLGVPVFDTVKEAAAATGAEASVIFVPARAVKSAVNEAAEAGLKLVVCISDNVPVRDMLEIRSMLRGTPTKLIGPDTPGVITPEEARLGIFPENIHKRGHIGIISRSSTLTYEAVLETCRAGQGQSTVVGLGDDMIIGMDFVETLKLFHEDEDTRAIVLIGQMGSQFEELGAEWYASCPNKKPVIGFVAGNDLTFSRHIGYAGDIITRGRITVEGKRRSMSDSGMIVVDNINRIHEELNALFK
uniref:Succinate--CoA ligase [ADP-forming] subunit alpha n=1 Tax=uncultured Alphaproteobacteria bacterium TaxID=91750 RepID=A0A6G8F2Q8_9PROT|nr:succinate--CoA ligase [ADP-forming] subunit alpha [uncultured Alphaproteobacteria bacterium]